MPLIARALVLVVLALAGAGCGGVSRIGDDLPRQDARLMLDAPAGAVHAGIVLAAERGFDRGEGVRLRIRRRAAGGPLASLRRERVDAALVDIAELARMRAGGADMVGVMALVQRPMRSVLAPAGVRSPSGLEGRAVAVGDGSTASALLRSMVEADSGDPDAVRIRRGADPARALRAGRADGAVVDAIAEGVPLRLDEPRLRELRPEAFGVPAYPGVVMVVSRRTLDERGNVVRALIRTLQRGYREAQVDPESAASALQTRAPGTERRIVMAQLNAVSSRWTAGTDAYGELKPASLRDWARWAVASGAVDRAPRIDRAFDTTLVTRQSTP